jgi:hypothetical protein
MLGDGPMHQRLQVSPQDGIFCCRRLISGKGVAADPLD